MYVNYVFAVLHHETYYYLDFFLKTTCCSCSENKIK